METENLSEANFVVTGGTAGSRMTTCGATSDEEVGIRTTYEFHWVYPTNFAQSSCAFLCYGCIVAIAHTLWRHQMETFSALLAFCAGNSPVTGEFPAQRPVTRSFDVFFDLCLNKRFSKQWWSWWFETPSRPLWRHCNDFCALLCFDCMITTAHVFVVLCFATVVLRLLHTVLLCFGCFGCMLIL